MNDSKTASPTTPKLYTVAAYEDPGNNYHVIGPYIAGGWDGTVPKSHNGMQQRDAEWLADLLNRAFAAGRDAARMTMRIAMGIEQ